MLCVLCARVEKLGDMFLSLLFVACTPRECYHSYHKCNTPNLINYLIKLYKELSIGIVEVGKLIGVIGFVGIII